jgi:hypothetical protein
MEINDLQKLVLRCWSGKPLRCELTRDGQGTLFGDFCLGGVNSFPLLGERVRVRASLHELPSVV